MLWHKKQAGKSVVPACFFYTKVCKKAASGKFCRFWVQIPFLRYSAGLMPTYFLNFL